MGLSRFELLTPRLSSVCSNQLSYRPSEPTFSAPLFKEPDFAKATSGKPSGLPAIARSAKAGSFKTEQDVSSSSPGEYQIDLRFCPPAPLRASARQSSRKEVIQPQVLLQLPCYDFTPITDHTLGACLPCGLAQRLLVQPAFVM